MRIKMIVSYDGSKFNGFQRLNNGSAVQNHIELALSQLYKQEILVKGSGRTDAKVHANYQVVHFDADKLLDNLKSKLNRLIGPNIIVKKCEVVKDDFHARSSVKKKEYVYKINLGAYQSSLNDYFYQCPFKLDISLMKEASRLFVGKHDFHNFVAGKRDNYFATIHSITFVKIFDKLEIHFIGTGFYRYMVRNLVGALLEVGKCKVSINVVEKMLNNPDEKQTLPTAIPEGLYLNKIWY